MNMRVVQCQERTGRVFCAIAFAAFLGVSAWASADSSVGPSLQRIKILKQQAYLFDFTALHGSRTPPLVDFPFCGPLEIVGLRTFYVFGAIFSRGNNPPVSLRWDIADEMLYCTRKSPTAFMATGVSRYPMEALSENAYGTLPLDRTKLQRAPDAPKYRGLFHPEGQVKSGFRWNDKGEWGPSPYAFSVREIYSDIRALDAQRIDLFMTTTREWIDWVGEEGKETRVDRKDYWLSQWRCDGNNWTFVREYDQDIAGPFLVCRGGRFIVAEVKGQWSLIGPLDEPGSRVINIVPKDSTEPLILVEDVAQTTNYFWFRDKLMDDTGRTVHTLDPAATNFDDRFHDVVAFVVSRRPGR